MSVEIKTCLKCCLCICLFFVIIFVFVLGQILLQLTQINDSFVCWLAALVIGYTQCLICLMCCLSLCLFLCDCLCCCICLCQRHLDTLAGRFGQRIHPVFTLSYVLRHSPRLGPFIQSLHSGTPSYIYKYCTLY